MDREIVDRITRKVARQFPEMRDQRPTVRQSGSGNGEGRFELVYKARAELPGGRSLQRVVRVIASGDGKVIRMSTSK